MCVCVKAKRIVLCRLLPEEANNASVHFGTAEAQK